MIENVFVRGAFIFFSVFAFVFFAPDLAFLGFFEDAQAQILSVEKVSGLLGRLESRGGFKEV